MFDMSKFEAMTNDECMDRYGWGIDGVPGTTAYVGTVGGYTVFCNQLPEGVYTATDVFACELCDADGATVSEGYGDTPADAIRAAFVDIASRDLEDAERNPEDAVNVCTFVAFEAMNGYDPMCAEDMGADEWDELDALRDVAYAYVERFADLMGIEWEEF